MSQSRVVMRPGVVVEQVGPTVLVFVPGSPTVVALSGEAATVLAAIDKGQTVAPSDPVVSELIEGGILEVRGITRRSVLKAGAVSLGAGVAVLAMPTVAAASSGGGSNEKPAGAIDIAVPEEGISYFAGAAQIVIDPNAYTASRSPQYNDVGRLLVGGNEYSFPYYPAESPSPALWSGMSPDITVAPYLEWVLTFTLGTTVYWATPA